MTAGQRNCYEALKEQADRYGLDDTLFAAREIIRDERDKFAGKQGEPTHFYSRENYSRAMQDVQRARHNIQRARAT